MKFDFMQKGVMNIFIYRDVKRGKRTGWRGFSAFRTRLRLAVWPAVIFGMFLGGLPIQAQNCPSRQEVLASTPPGLDDIVNPNPSEADLELPMPCGGKLILRHVCVPANGFFGDLRLDLGCKDCGRFDQSFMEGKHNQAIGGSFTLQDLPGPWRLKLAELANSGDGRCPKADDAAHKGFYFFISKYEITNFQWKSMALEDCSAQNNQFSADDPRPKTDISWFEAVEFTRKYTEWLIKNAPAALPAFSHKRVGYLRLPTEAEWEYAARGGHRVTESQMNTEEFFPLNERPLTDFAVFTEQEAAKPPEKLAWIGTKCSNPLGLFDTAGNAAEMVLDPFRFSVGFRLHGASGGFIIKGGSFRRGRFEVMPGRREEQPFFLGDGAFRSADVGFRVVLSGILTPEDRRESLNQEWANLGVGLHLPGLASKSSKSSIEMDQSENPIAEIDRLLEASGDETEKKNLLFLREVLKQNSILLGEQKAETVKGIIRSALLTAESLQNYAIRRRVVINELSKLEKMKAETVSQSILDSLGNGIVKAKETVGLIDAAIDQFGKFYLNRIGETQKYPEELFESQINLLRQELSLEDSFGRSLQRRLDQFTKHVALYKQRAGNIDREELQHDLLLKQNLSVGKSGS